MQNKSAVFSILSVFILSLSFSVSAQTTAAKSGADKQGKSQILTPEVFELANIAFALTAFSETNENMTEKSGAYYEKVLKHFAPYKDHRLIKTLDQLIEKNYMAYVANRGYAINFAFDGEKLKATNDYPPERRFQLLILGDAFKDLSLWEEFAKQSNFRAFYAQNNGFYRKTLASVERNLPLAKIQTWLEREFPARFDRYRIHVSPLIGGTHSTFSSDANNLKQCFMFVSDDRFIGAKRWTAKQIEGLYTGIFFTEIDHNYNNPVSQKYAAEIAQTMTDPSKWSGGRKPPPEIINRRSKSSTNTRRTAFICFTFTTIFPRKIMKSSKTTEQV